MATELRGYKKRIAHRRSGNPGPNQQWVPVGHPNAARPATAEEMRATRNRESAVEHYQRQSGDL